MKVLITEKDTGKSVATYTINYLAGTEPTPSDDMYFSDAWREAVDDGVVNDESREKYSFILLRE